MPNSRGFIEYLLELLRPAGAPTARGMFGGHGLYIDGMIVAIVVDDVLYFKTDAESRPRFLERSLEAFVFRKRKTGETEVTSYYRAPDEALESPDAMREWLRLAIGAALRAASKRDARVKPAGARRAPAKRTRAR